MRPLRRADNLTIFMCRLSLNLGVLTSWNPQDLSRPVKGLLYHLTEVDIVVSHSKNFFSLSLNFCRSQWPRSLRRRSAAARLLRS